MGKKTKNLDCRVKNKCKKMEPIKTLRKNLPDPEQFRLRKLKIIVIFYKYATFRMEWEADGSQFSRGSNMGPGTRTGIRTGDHNSGAEPTEGDGSTGGEGNSSPTREVSN